MAWGIATKSPKSPNTRDTRWFRLSGTPSERLEFDQIFDLYWGGPERRLTGITIRIIGVNATALIILMLGILYLGQYQSTVIEARLKTFQSELDLMAASLTQSIDAPISQNNPIQASTQTLIANLSYTSRQRLTLLSPEAVIVSDSFSLLKTNANDFFAQTPQLHFHSVQVLKDMAALVLSVFPVRENLLYYEEISPQNAHLSPDIRNAQEGEISLSVWTTDQDQLVLTAATPLYKNNQMVGILLLTREGQDIKNSIAEVWLNVLKVFGITLIFTILFSIYLSGVIAKPLRKLAQAAEAVRRGQARAEDIPDLSHRHDEIGELSIVLRQMTRALWERMDSIEQFAADVAHELKNPLTSLRSAVETVALVKKEEDRTKLMGIIQHDIMRLDRLITDIATASRLDSQLSREEFKSLNLTKLLQHFLSSYDHPLERGASEKESAAMTFKIGDTTLLLRNVSGEDVYVWGLESRLGQVFQNLISNALSFSPPQGQIFITITPLRRRVSIMFEDRGPGIPESKRSAIFERFYSERPDHEQFGQHSGLGLSICKQIVEAHGGRIFVNNVKDDQGQIIGARFTVLLNKSQ